MGSHGRKTSNKIPGDSEKSGESNGVNGIMWFVVDVPLNQDFREIGFFKEKHHNSLGYTVFWINKIIGGVQLGAWDPWLPLGTSYKFYRAVNNHRRPILA